MADTVLILQLHRARRAHIVAGTAADTGLGLRKYGRDEFIENWNEIMLTVQPTERFAREKSDRTSLQNFAAFVTPLPKGKQARR